MFPQNVCWVGKTSFLVEHILQKNAHINKLRGGKLYANDIFNSLTRCTKIYLEHRESKIKPVKVPEFGACQPIPYIVGRKRSRFFAVFFFCVGIFFISLSPLFSTGSPDPFKKIVNF